MTSGKKTRKAAIQRKHVAWTSSSERVSAQSTLKADSQTDSPRHTGESEVLQQNLHNRRVIDPHSLTRRPQSTIVLFVTTLDLELFTFLFAAFSSFLFRAGLGLLCQRSFCLLELGHSLRFRFLSRTPSQFSLAMDIGGLADLP
jgi:hypothetical protein